VNLEKKMFFKKMGVKKMKPLFTTETLRCNEHQSSQKTFLQVVVDKSVIRQII